MSWFGWLSGGAKSAEKVLDGIISGGDALVLTQEERIQYNAKAAEQWLELQKVIASESSPQSVSRRIIAWGVLGMMIVCTLICAVAILFGRPDLSDAIIELAGKMWWGQAFTSVIIFYFGTHALAKLGKK